MFYYTAFSLIIFALRLENGRALYEDQIGKFDWTKNLVGVVKYSTFSDSVADSKSILVATEENVVASISSNTGEIIWRKVLEKGDLGNVRFLCASDNIAYTVTGTNIIRIRGWDVKYGFLINRWSVELSPFEYSRQTLWSCDGNKLYRVSFYSDQYAELSSWKIRDGGNFSQRNISSGDLSYRADGCAIGDGILLCCLGSGSTMVANIGSQNPVFQRIPLTLTSDGYCSVRASSISGNAVFTLSSGVKKVSVAVDDELRVIESKTVTTDFGDVSLYKTSSSASAVTVISDRISERVLEIEGCEPNDTRTLFRRRFDLKTSVKKITILGVDCVVAESEEKICSVLLTSSDGALIYLKSSGELTWLREEGLANIVSAEMIELPMSDAEAEMQNEFDTKESNIFKMLARRFSSHACQLQKFVLGISGVLEKSFSKRLNHTPFERDYFNLHKIILIVTGRLKIFAIDNISRRILWTYLLDDSLESFPVPCENCQVRIPLFIQRTYRHYPRPMQCTLLLRDRKTGNGVIVTFNPLNGLFQTYVRLDFKIKQATLLPRETSGDYLRGIMILKEDNSIFMYPTHANAVVSESARDNYIYVGDAHLCEVNGYTFGPDIRNVTLVPAWNMKCVGKIIKILGRNPIEKVHSQGRVMADRSVLYKYINPNLIVVVSQSINADDKKSMLTLYFVDSVTGVIVNADVRHKASSPVHLIHSENWIILMYFNDKARRTEVVTYELYEGKSQKNSTAFSSVRSKSLRPIIDSRAYILPSSHVEAAKETITEKGITSKQVLVALGTGSVIELPWIILDPRRPYLSAAESKEDGVLPYMPEIPVPTDRFVNYNVTLNRVRGIITSPTGLESTSLIFVYGLDLFYTRTAPSKTFDLLKEDFDYTLIIIVLVLLVILTCFTKHLAYRRALRQVWR